MKRLGLTLLILAVTSGIAYYVFTHPSLSQAERLRTEVDKLREENRKLAEQNEELEERVAALDDDRRLAERKARESSGLVRSDEIIFEFDDGDEEIEIEVKLEVEPDAATLAGEQVELDGLEEALVALREDVPRARLSVVFAEETDALRRQRVRDAVEASPLSAASFETVERATN